MSKILVCFFRKYSQDLALLEAHRPADEEARLEVAGVGPFHADARAGKVRAAEIDRAAVEDQHLEMDPRTEHPLQSFRQRRVLVEVLAEGGAGFLGVDEAHLNSLAHQLRQHREERQRAVPDFHVEVFDVGGANPQRLPDGDHSGEDKVVVVGVGDVGEHNASWGYNRLFEEMCL